MRPRRSIPPRRFRRLRSRARRWAKPLCRLAVLVWFGITSLGIPLAQASPQDADGRGEGPLAAGTRNVTGPDGADENSSVVVADELCVLPELLAPPESLGRCGCSLTLQAAGRCCCVAAKPAAVKSCCAKPSAPGTVGDDARNKAGDQDAPVDRFACLTCPCGSGSDAWIAAAAEPRILGDAVVLAPGGMPIEHLVAATPHLPQVFLPPDAPPPRMAERSPASL